MFVAEKNMYDGGAKTPRGAMEVNENCNVGGIKVVSAHLVFIVFVRHKSSTLFWTA